MKRKSILSAAAALLILLTCSGCQNLFSGSEGTYRQLSVISGESPDAEGKPTDETTVTEATAEETTTEPAAGKTEETSSGEMTEKKTSESEDAQDKEQPFLVQITEDDPSIAYVLVRMPNPIGLLPLPLEGEYKRTIRRAMADGTEAVNVLHLTSNGFRMEDANCEGHDCIQEGEVTLENREERVLWNMIICLPHQLSLELITREEAEQMMR